MRAPGSNAFAELLQQYWILACSVVLGIGSEEFVDVVEEVPCHMTSLFRSNLNYVD